MTDPDTRRAAWIATLVAVPIALLAGLALWPRDPGPPEPTPSPSQAAPTSSASMDARELTTRAATVCRGLIAMLPATTLGELPRRPVTAGPEQNAAYGHVLLRCGVDAVTLPDTSTETVYPLSKVCWVPKRVRGGTVWTTLDREVPVSVTIEGSPDETGQWVTALSRYVVKTPPGGDPPSGCRA